MRQITTNEGLTITTFLTPEGVTIRLVDRMKKLNATMLTVIRITVLEKFADNSCPNWMYAAHWTTVPVGCAAHSTTVPVGCTALSTKCSYTRGACNAKKQS